MDLISVIVPIYNTECEILNKCIMSIIEQTYKNIEIILINDGSNAVISEKYKLELPKDSRIKFVCKKNEGVSIARNTGLELAKGEYIVFVDSDDYIESNYIERLYQVIKEENADICFTSSNKIYKNSVERQKIYKVQKGKKLVYSKENKEFSPYNLDLMGTVWGKIYKKNIINDIRFDSSLKFGEDIVFNFRVFNSNLKYCYINEFLYQYVINDESTIRKFNEETIILYENTIEKLKKIVSSTDKEKYNLFLLYICTFYRMICMNYICNKDNKIGQKNKLLQMREIREKSNFKLGIDNANLEKMRFSRRLPIMCAKKNMFFLMYLILELREMQTKIMK